MDVARLTPSGRHKHAVPVTADDEGSDLMEPPTGTEIAEPAPSVATDAATSKPLGGGRTRISPDDTFDIVSGVELDERETLAFGMRRATRKPEDLRLSPDPTKWPRRFLTARPKAKKNPVPNLRHVCSLEHSIFKFEQEGLFLPCGRRRRSLSNRLS
jgi:hypothetical protein